MKINVKLLNEGSKVYLPMNVKEVYLGLYEIEYTNYDKTDVFPEFIEGDIVKVHKSEDEELYAVEKTNNLDREVIYIKNKNKDYIPTPTYANKIDNNKYFIIDNEYTWNNGEELEFNSGDIVKIERQYLEKFGQEFEVAIY